MYNCEMIEKSEGMYCTTIQTTHIMNDPSHLFSQCSWTQPFEVKRICIFGLFKVGARYGGRTCHPSSRQTGEGWVWGYLELMHSKFQPGLHNGTLSQRTEPTNRMENTNPASRGCKEWFVILRSGSIDGWVVWPARVSVTPHPIFLIMEPVGATFTTPKDLWTNTILWFCQWQDKSCSRWQTLWWVLTQYVSLLYV